MLCERLAFNYSFGGYLLFVLEHLNPVNVKIAELREALEAVSAEQRYLRARDTRHRLSISLFLSVLLLSAYALPLAVMKIVWNLRHISFLLGR